MEVKRRVIPQATPASLMTQKAPKTKEDVLFEEPAVKLQAVDAERRQRVGLTTEMLSQFVAGLPAAEFDKAWSTYDADKAGSLREKQLLALTADLLGRVPNLFRVLLKRVHAKAPRPALDKMAIEELPHILPGTKQEVAVFLVKTLEFNDQQRVTKEEFSTRWNRSVSILLAGVEQKENQGGLACAIL